MSKVDLFMPKPIPVPLPELNALTETMNQLRTLNHPIKLPFSMKPMTSFLTVAPIALAGGVVNRGMLVDMIEMGEQVLSNTDFIPWVNLKPIVKEWFAWVECRSRGCRMDDIDAVSLSVQVATDIIPFISDHEGKLSRKAYPTELPFELLAWNVYSDDKGYCVFALPECDKVSLFSVDDINFSIVPVAALQAIGWKLRDGFIIYKDSKLASLESDYMEFDCNE